MSMSVNLNPDSKEWMSKVVIDYNILKLIDNRPSCPLYWKLDAQFVIDPRVISNMYLSQNDVPAPGVANKLSKFYGKDVLFQRTENWEKTVETEYAAAPGWFEMFVQNSGGEWVPAYQML